MAGNSVEVYVKLPTGRSVKFDMLPRQTVSALCDLISKDEGVESNFIRLKYQGKVLNLTKTIQEYGIRVETILKAEFMVPSAIDFQLQLPEGDLDGIECYNLDPMAKLFHIVAEKLGETSDRIKLKSGKKDLKQSAVSIQDVGIEAGSLIVASIVSEEEIKEKRWARKEEAAEMNEADKDAVLSSFQTDGKSVDVVFSFDTTGSMYSYLEQVRSKLRSTCTRLLEDIPRIRIGIIAHGDYCDEGSPYVLRSADLTESADSLTRFASDAPSTSGGDSPECYEWVLRKAQHMDWGEDSAKALVVIGDLYPHQPSYTDQNIKWRDELDILKGMGVKVYGIQAGRCTEAANFYAELADVTGGKHLNLQHFDVITDMFLAVCYREGNEELLEEFEQEIQTAGNMTVEKQAMFNQLKEDKKPKESNAAEPTRYVSSAWWDHALDKSTTPSYVYDAKNDRWDAYTNPTFSISRPSTFIRGSTRRRSKRSKGKGRCAIM